jgi:DNA gyrase subunit A
MENGQMSSHVTDVDINKEMREAYLQYSMSVIVGRALPDVRDGLKPVHRRILYAQYEMNNTHDKPYKKSARVVGDVIGKYHPHGDSAVYDTMVRMAQDFSMRYVLEDGQGNFGSIDGDSPAAMRYTEIRMTKLAEALLEDIDKETVPFGPNYDDSLQIPLVLPAKFPNLLVNGSSGIAVGMATNIPPHNLSEVIDATVHLIDRPDSSIDELMEKIPGPDFPTAGTISGLQGIREAYKTGRGIITIKAKAEIESLKDGREEIVVTEIPYQVNKAKLIESIADLVKEKKIEGITDIRDESSREGMRIVISVKRGENASVLLNRLFKFTQLQVSYGIILLALDKNNQPVTFDLKGLIQSFIEHRRDVVTKRSLFELKKAQEREHILLGLKKALDHIDEIVSLIRASSDAKQAEEALMKRFDFTLPQTKAILEMRLQRLTGLERSKIDTELKELADQIAYLNKILGDVSELMKVIKNELIEIKDKFGDNRRTRIEGSEGEIEDEDLISDDAMVVVITNTGYIKRIPIQEYRTQKRGGRGLKGMETIQEDYVVDVFTATNKTPVLVFTSIGKVYATKVYQLPIGSRTSKGRSIANVIKLSSSESVTAVLPIIKGSANKYVVMITKNGVIKKTELDEFKNVRGSGIIALTTDLDDSLIDVKISSGEDDIFIATRQGMSIRFHESEVRAMGRSARGVKGITLAEGDYVVSLEVIRKGLPMTILTVSEKGFGKRSDVEEYRVQGRGGVGIITQGNIEKVGAVVGARVIRNEQEVILTTDSGQMIRIPGSSISVIGRNTQGVKLITLQEGEKVTSFTLVDENVDEEKAEESGISN